jgi:hypothetical protein
MASQSLLEVLEYDDSLPIEKEALHYWLADMKHPLRMGILPVVRMLCSVQLHLTFFIKRLLPFQFSAHHFLQGLICWFMKWWITPEANALILRHYTTESNIINFLIANTHGVEVEPLKLYPKKISDMMEDSFVAHDQELFRSMKELGSAKGQNWPISHEKLDWSTWRPMEVEYDTARRKWTQCLDFETSHELFKAIFCLLLTAREYEDAINGFQLDQSIAIRISKIVNDPVIPEMAYNKFPLLFTRTGQLTRRFVLHGLFTEHLHAYLERLRAASAAVESN